MDAKRLRLCGAVLSCWLGAAGLGAWAEEAAPAGASEQQAESPAHREFLQRIAALHWIKGPTTVDTVGDSSLEVPEGYVFLDQAETRKFLEMNQNLSDGSEMMVAPQSLDWTAYISFSDEGYVKDDEKIDAPALLKTMQENTRASNAERRKRGWAELQLIDWARAPAYNGTTKRLEWATRLSDGQGESANFLTKILGRKGHSTIVMVASPTELAKAERELNAVLAGYRFKPGSAYADFIPGDKVAEYGLAALVLGGAAAVATKKGLWAVLAGFFAAAWKFLAVGVVALGGWLRKIFSGRRQA